MKAGVLSLQGAAREHAVALKKCGAETVFVKHREQLDNLDCLVIPGGESTTIGKLLDRFGLGPALQEFMRSGRAVYGTCAGMILLANKVDGPPQYTLGGMEITVRRNAFGRQRESFEADLEIPVLGRELFRSVFIRAPLIIRTGAGVEVLATYRGRAVATRQGNLLVSSFHPELTDDIRMHAYFLRLAEKKQ
ncbi:MAG TPA: pyridoxal 5'-phosphate synthase glutaminase subunit PdxT [Firmicutes bacterium]|jgi:5'-phosphate synthase pdxT subunit|nr:pyridoxal 5'-phosphate synthase glutaminase subunit PdxT [Bacillota bacterium]